MWQLNPIVWVKWLISLSQKVDKIMSTLADLKAVIDGINAKMDPLGVNVGAAKTGVDALIKQVADLKAALGTTLPPDQQALLDGIVTEAGGISTAVDGISAGVSSIQAEAPVPPPATSS